ncbi:MAG: DsbA family protein [Rhodospirillaceae bacterium]|nr:DsbA family protein [Rhodospirillaceae bacterium]
MACKITKTITTMFSLLIVISMVVVFNPNNASAEQQLSPEQKQEIQSIVREYLLQNPEVIVDSIRELRRRDEAAAAESRKNALGSLQDKLEKDSNDPFIGNPDGDITIVEFFDYRCGYCKKVFPDVRKLLKEDGNIKFVLKEWPILGDDSVYASKAALSVWFGQTAKYNDFHGAMMENKGSLSNDRVIEIAAEQGIDVEKMKVGFADPRVEMVIANNTELAGNLNVTGTPAFVFGKDLMPGAIDYETMKQLVDGMRAKN